MARKSAAKRTAPAKPAAKTAAARRSAPSVRNFDAARSSRRLRSLPTATTAINAQIRSYGRTLLARSRHLCANNPYASNAREYFVSAMVGDGIKPTSDQSGEIKRTIQQAWLDWTDYADADGLTDFYGLQAMIAGEMFEAGECFVRLIEAPELPIPLQLQVIPSEMVPLDKTEVLGNGWRIEAGIEFDSSNRRVAYWVHPVHPDDDTSRVIDNMPRRIPASEMLHLFRPTQAGQIRGYPSTTSAIAALAMLDRYDDAELERKSTTALFAVAVTNPAGEDGSPLGEPTEGESWGLEPGAVITLEPGQDIKPVEPSDVGASYEMFQYRALLRVAAGMGIPYAALTGDLRQTSYGSIRAGLVEFRRRIQAAQNHILIFQFCRPVWQRWFKAAVAARELPGIRPSAFIAAPMSFARVQWKPPRWDWIDPLHDLQAEKLAVDNGFKARSDVIDETGEDAEAVDARIKSDREREAAMGVQFPIPQPGQVIGPSLADNQPEPGPADPSREADEAANAE